MSRRAVALLSGGLDSVLAVIVMRGQGIEISAVRFTMPFESGSRRVQPLSDWHRSVGERWGFDITIHRLGREMLDIVKHPKHGHGKNVNPCIDCRILMLREAKKYMDSLGAQFLVTGEVVGQRPMSQKKDMLYHIEKEAGVPGLIVRPLSARLLRVTLPEEQGIIRREDLFDMSGRSRRGQIALARAFGLTDYPAPAGGCLLTDPIFAFRLRELLFHDAEPSLRDIELLKVGRHFRFSRRCKIIVGRNKAENARIESLAQEEEVLLRVVGFGGPTTLVTGDATDEALRCAASICVRYSDAGEDSGTDVRISSNRGSAIVRASSAGEETLSALRIGPMSESVTV